MPRAKAETCQPAPSWSGSFGATSGSTTSDIAPDEIMFVRSTGKPVTYGTFANIRQKARQLTLSKVECASPPAEDPYSLRHAALSTWLNNGVPPAEVAKRAGHTIEMLFRTYAKCVMGQEDLANKRIEEALGKPDPDL